MSRHAVTRLEMAIAAALRPVIALVEQVRDRTHVVAVEDATLRELARSNTTVRLPEEASIAIDEIDRSVADPPTSEHASVHS